MIHLVTHLNDRNQEIERKHRIDNNALLAHRSSSESLSSVFSKNSQAPLGDKFMEPTTVRIGDTVKQVSKSFKKLLVDSFKKSNYLVYSYFTVK